MFLETLTGAEIAEWVALVLGTPACAWLAWQGFKRESARSDSLTERQRNEQREDWMI